jgi:hypothetical protein
MECREVGLGECGICREVEAGCTREVEARILDLLNSAVALKCEW